jgi:hypothetical protein
MHSARKSKEADSKLKTLVNQGRDLNSDLDVVKQIFKDDISYRARTEMGEYKDTSPILA